MNIATRRNADIAVLAEVFGRDIEWTPVALSESEWPDEALDGTIDGFREATYGAADYLVGVRGMWSHFPEPSKFSLWRMNKGETDWRFLGHFDYWLEQWTKAQS